MTSLLARIASIVGHRPRLATVAVLLAAIAVIGGAIAVGGTFRDDFMVPGIESQRAQELLETRFRAQSGTSATLVFTGALERGEIRAALDAIERQSHVVAVEDPFTTPGRLSKDGDTAYATVSCDETADELDATERERLQDATSGLSGVDVAMSGEVVDGAATAGFPIGERSDW